MVAWLVTLLACSWGQNAHILEGTVVEVDAASVVVAHGPVPEIGMDAMTMPFDVHDPSLLDGVKPGDRIYARLMIDQSGTWLDAIRVTGHGVVPDVVDDGPAPLRAGQQLPRVDLPLADGTTTVLGAGQGKPTAVAFLYTTCPIPEYCPLTVSRLQSLQDQLGDHARIVAVTIDPEHDTAGVLKDFADKVGAKHETWVFGRLEKPALDDLALRAAMTVTEDDGGIVHALRLLVLDADGRLIERYDDNRWPQDRVVSQLLTGGPPAPAGSDGTVTP